MNLDHRDLFSASGGGIWGNGFPSISADEYRTHNGTRFLKQPGVVLLAKTDVNLNGIIDFLEDGFDGRFSSYAQDEPIEDNAQLVKLAGQLCYMSFGENRTKNAEAGKYLQHIRESGHGSVLEHVQYSFLIYGCSRSFTHELVRHRAGMAYSQVSQRYVGADCLRFVERPEYLGTEITAGEKTLHDRFMANIDKEAAYYEESCDLLLQQNPPREGESKTEARKRVRQAARESLPNCTEAPILVSGNARAWRHFIEMRGSKFAEVEIRRVAVRVLLCLSHVSPLLFEDYVIESSSDGFHTISTPTRKV